MLKKLLTGCLTIAMIGAFSASASAEADVTWTGNVTGSLIQTSEKAATKDAETITYMDMLATADIELSAKVAGDVWTGEAKFELDATAGNTKDATGDITASALEVDDLYVVLSKEGLEITFGEFDPFGIGKGGDYLGEIDDTIGAGGVGTAFGEKGLAMVGLTDVGLNLLLGFNKVGEAADKEVASETVFGAQFDKAFGDLGLAVGYYAASRSINEDDSDATKDSDNDGFTANEIALAVQYTLGNMAFALNYTSYNDKDGGAAEAENKNTYAELFFDMGIGDDKGLTASYASIKETKNDGTSGAKDIDTDKTVLNLTFMFKLGLVENYITYQNETEKEDSSGAEEGSTAKLGYSMKVAF